MSISSREKILLAVLVTVFILFGGFKFLITPQLDALKQERETLFEVQEQKKTADRNLKIKDNIFNDNAKLRDDIQKKAAPFFHSLKSDEIELFFHGLLSRVGVKADSFIMSKLAVVQIDNPSLIESSPQYPMKNIAEQIENMDSGSPAKKSAAPSGASKKEKSAPDDAVEMVMVSIQLNAPAGKGLALVEEINNNKNVLRVTSLNMSEDAENNSASISITAQCFGLTKLSGK